MEEQIALGDDYKIINDKTDAAGVRHITAAPSALVCSKQIDFDIVDGKIHNLKYLRGCDGNEGMPAEKAKDILLGVNCHGRGTSCTDQLARILEKQVL